MQVVPGSHRLTGPPPINPETGRPHGAIEIYAEPGDALLFEQRLWHAAAPNITPTPRICLFYAYGFRWLRPDECRDVRPQIMDSLPPVRRQLLGAVESQLGYYLPASADLPLRHWLKDGANA
jgi:ectoine hydroxylase-related dioxygenase (phytanoyl-CoA dioxygenase family)